MPRSKAIKLQASHKLRNAVFNSYIVYALSTAKLITPILLEVPHLQHATRPTNLRAGADSRSSARCANVATAHKTFKFAMDQSSVSLSCRCVAKWACVAHTILDNCSDFEKAICKTLPGTLSEPRPVHFATSEKRLYHGTSSTVLSFSSSLVELPSKC